MPTTTESESSPKLLSSFPEGQTRALTNGPYEGSIGTYDDDTWNDKTNTLEAILILDDGDIVEVPFEHLTVRV